MASDGPVWICSLACCPLVSALRGDTLVSRVQVHVEVVIAEEQPKACGANICSRAVNLNVVAATFASYPAGSRPLADAPSRLLEGAANVAPKLAAVVADRTAPRVLASVLPEAGVRIADQRAHAVRLVVIAPAVATRITFADRLCRLHRIHRLCIRQGSREKQHGGSGEGVHGGGC